MKRLLSIFIFLFIAQLAGSQTDTVFWEPQFRHGVKYAISTSAGTSYRGFVVEEDATHVIIEDRETHEHWRIQKTGINASRILGTREAAEEVYGRNYHAGSYMLSHAAFTFEEESARTQSHWFILENTDIAITENWA